MNETLPIKKRRNSSIDVTKGILISCLVLHHIESMGTGKLCLDNDVLSFVSIVQGPLYLCYFMPAFFFITGLCSSFDKDLVPFITKQIKTLLLPTIVFSYIFYFYNYGFHFYLKQVLLFGGRFWFLEALFISKILFYLLRKLKTKDKYLVVILIAINLLGVVLNEADVIPNYLWHRQILDLTLFLGVGSVFRDRILSIKQNYIPVSVYLSLALLLLVGGGICRMLQQIFHFIGGMACSCDNFSHGFNWSHFYL